MKASNIIISCLLFFVVLFVFALVIFDTGEWLAQYGIPRFAAVVALGVVGIVCAVTVEHYRPEWFGKK